MRVADNRAHGAPRPHAVTPALPPNKTPPSFLVETHDADLVLDQHGFDRPSLTVLLTACRRPHRVVYLNPL